jgi:hypothetical protein
MGHGAWGMGHWALGIGHWALGMGYWAWGIGHGALVYRKLKGLRPQPKHVAPVSVLRQAQ